MNKYLSMVAFALVGAMMTGCSNDDCIIDDPQQPENMGNVVTLTTTVGLDCGATTRALTVGGVKTFAAGDKIAVIYKNTGGTTVKAVSEALQDNGDITNSGKNATFTFTLTNPDRTQDVMYIYPAAMAGETDVDYSKFNSQDGTLANISSNLDLAVTYRGVWNGDNLPTAILHNQLAILAITLMKDSDITNSITNMTFKGAMDSPYNTCNITITGHDSDGHIYVAIPCANYRWLTVTATDGTNTYYKYWNDKFFKDNTFTKVTWNMADVVWTPDEISTYAWEGVNSFIIDDITWTTGTTGTEYDSWIKSGTFTAPSGKSFAKIEVFGVYDSNIISWTWDNVRNVAIWTGSSASASYTGDDGGESAFCPDGILFYFE